MLVEKSLLPTIDIADTSILSLLFGYLLILAPVTCILSKLVMRDMLNSQIN
jgi:hypothetical protein